MCEDFGIFGIFLEFKGTGYTFGRFCTILANGDYFQDLLLLYSKGSIIWSNLKAKFN